MASFSMGNFLTAAGAKRQISDSLSIDACRSAHIAVRCSQRAKCDVVAEISMQQLQRKITTAISTKQLRDAQSAEPRMKF